MARLTARAERCKDDTALYPDVLTRDGIAIRLRLEMQKTFPTSTEAQYFEPNASHLGYCPLGLTLEDSEILTHVDGRQFKVCLPIHRDTRLGDTVGLSLYK